MIKKSLDDKIIKILNAHFRDYPDGMSIKELQHKLEMIYFKPITETCLHEHCTVLTYQNLLCKEFCLKEENSQVKCLRYKVIKK